MNNAQLVGNMALISFLPVIETMMEKSGSCCQTIKVDCTETMDIFQGFLYNEFTKDWIFFNVSQFLLKFVLIKPHKNIEIVYKCTVIVKH